MTEGKLLGRINITGIVELKTGMHIGRSKDTLQIGGIDNPIIRDPLSDEPYIPGSSLKGKMRSLVERILVGAGDSSYGFDVKSSVGGGITIYRHECPTAEIAVECPVCRLFGANGNEQVLGRYVGRGNQNPLSDDASPRNFPARMAVWDAYLTQDSVNNFRKMSDLPYGEWKSENTVDRLTSAANPRQVERAAKGLQFEFHLTYDIKPDGKVIEDLQNLLFALWLIERSGIGGQTSRGYGQVTFSDIGFCVEHYKVDISEGALGKFAREAKDNLIHSKPTLIELRDEVSSQSYADRFMEDFPEAWGMTE